MLKIKKNKIKRKLTAAACIFSLLFLQSFPLAAKANWYSEAMAYIAQKKAETQAAALQKQTAAITGESSIEAQSKEKSGIYVDVSFGAAGPITKPGVKVTATALPNGFADQSKLYYTWYIKHKECGLTNSDDPGDLAKCDLDGDSKITENDWKIAASRFVVQGDFNHSDSTIYNITGFDENIAGTKAVPIVEDTDKNKNDSWKKTVNHDLTNSDFSQSDNQDNAPNCYVQDSVSGSMFELRTLGDSKLSDCPSGYHPACVGDTPTACQVASHADARVDAQNIWSTANATTISNCIATATTSCTASLTASCTSSCTASLTTSCTSSCSADPDPPTCISACVSAGLSACVSPCVSTQLAACVGTTSGSPSPATHAYTLYHSAAGGQTYTCMVTAGYYADYTGSPVNSCKASNEAENSSNAKINGIMSCADNNATMDDLRKQEVSPGCYGADGKISTDLIATCMQDNNKGLDLKNTANPVVILNHILGKSDSTSNTTMCTNYLTTIVGTGTADCADPSYNTIKITCLSGNKDDAKCAGILSSIIYGGTDSEGNVIAKNPNIMPTCSFEKGENICKHLFPWFSEDGTKVSNLSNKDVDKTHPANGDGKFTLDEMKFWGANPDTKKTNGKTNGKQKDEAAVMGLGVNSMTWAYQAGDQVGVAVEGKANLATAHNDASSMIMWAFSKGTCSALDIDKDANLTVGSDKGDREIQGDRGFYYATDGGNKPVLVADVDLDSCLEENLLDPKDSDGLNGMKVNLSSTPATNLVNDPSGYGSHVTVTASPQNVEDLSSLFYDWHIEKSEDTTDANGTQTYPTNDTKWTEITSDFSGNISALSGIGTNNVKFSLKLGNITAGTKIFYLRAKTIVDGDSGQSGIGYLVLRVLQQGNSISVNSVSAASDGKLSIASPIIACNSGGICSVTNNEIIGLQINDNPAPTHVTWKINNKSTINGKPIGCTTDISSNCSASGSTLFFPVLGEEGNAINVVATFTDNGEKKQLSKQFIIIKPQIEIKATGAPTLSDCNIATNNICPKLLGNFIDIDGNKTPDYSKEIFEVREGANDVALAANLVSSWGGSSNVTYGWSLDGESLDNDSQTISFPITKQTGDSYNVVLVSNHNVGGDMPAIYLRKALVKNWGVDPTDFMDEDMSASVQINVLENPLVSLGLNKTGIMASLITNLPQQALFLLEIVLTAFALIFSMGLLFAFIPESIFKKERNNVF